MRFFSFKHDNGSVTTLNLDKVCVIEFDPPHPGVFENGRALDGRLYLEHGSGKIGSAVRLSGKEACRFHDELQIALRNLLPVYTGTPRSGIE